MARKRTPLEAAQATAAALVTQLEKVAALPGGEPELIAARCHAKGAVDRLAVVDADRRQRGRS